MGASLLTEPSLQKALLDRVYDKRKAAALELERCVRADQACARLRRAWRPRQGGHDG